MRRLQARAQLTQGRHLIRLTLLPGSQQLGQRFAVGLRREFAQGQLSLLKRLALGAEGRVTQTGPARLKALAIPTALKAAPLTRTASDDIGGGS